MKAKLSNQDTFTIGLMLFALFLGAGNMIFPPALGQAAGENIWIAIAGFLFTGVGLPLLGVTAIGLTGGSLNDIASRVHPVFGLTFTAVLYLAIGPFFGIPRTGTVAFEIGVVPFLSESTNPTGLPLLLYTIVFFGITFWVALNPTRLVDRVGKILTPLLILVLGSLIIGAFINPPGSLSPPSPNYESGVFFKGFLDGYLTMDAIAALVFGIVVIKAVNDRGVTDRKTVSLVVLKAGVLAAIGLTAIYLSLAYIGATSLDLVGEADNGGEILSSVASYLFGSFGTVLLGAAITFACLTTSVGLVTACGEYFSKVYPKLSYKTVILIVTLFSAFVANLGLTQLITFTVPVLIAIYPIAIVLIFLTFINYATPVHNYVYRGAILLTTFISIPNAIEGAGLNIEFGFLHALPLYSEGVGWLLPAVAGGVIGLLILQFKQKN
ncbi:branched-chain amino acid transport system II carrier protein [Pseudalkalibacillus hwajinpoensis]|uniref:Branched-chain amino acid transport system carrier protein n=1 Tax=Guptibacillus hwajinpoensis TaxID=208199 RepID=A0A4U1MAF0_9BACL|nr:branched-chain amino acid transport system II carrier protein [Pseudalkalibacillus hwajinpoensis]TKD67949.1 branched-chain amino acid transport system II carrier protein [Pseudalkalibacillus hwajinpoensis]